MTIMEAMGKRMEMPEFFPNFSRDMAAAGMLDRRQAPNPMNTSHSDINDCVSVSTTSLRRGKRISIHHLLAIPVAAFALVLAVSCSGKKETAKEHINPEVLFKAIEDSDTAKIKETILKDPDLAKAKDGSGFTALYFAAGNGWQDICEILLKDGADIGAGGGGGDTPLHFACMNGWKEAAETLLAHKAGVNKQDNEGYTPLMRAAFNGHDEIVKLLLAKGADPKLKEKTGKTALELAEGNKCADIVEILKNPGK